MNNSVKPHLASKILYDNRNQQDYELDVFMDFTLRLGFEDFKIAQPNPPRPDIEIKFLNKRKEESIVVGCEIKDLYWDKKNNGSPEKRKFEKWKSFTSRLRENLDNSGKGFEYLYGVVGLKDFSVINNGKNQEKLSREIIKFLKSYNLPININLDSFEDNEYLSENINYLRIETYAERGILWWETSLLSGRTGFDLKIFDEEIKQKSKKIHDFSSCDKKWLLLFAEANNLGNVVTFPFHLMDERPEIENNHKFDKVFWFDHFYHSIYEISPSFKRLFSVDKEESGIRHFESYKELIE